MQVNDQWMQTMQLLAAAAQTMRPPQSGAQSQGTQPSFRDLMEQKQQQTKPTDSGRPEQDESGAPATGQTPGAEDGAAEGGQLQLEIAAALAQGGAVVLVDQQAVLPAGQQVQVAAQPQQVETAQAVQDAPPQLQPQQEGEAQTPQPLQGERSVPAVSTQTQDAVQAASQTQMEGEGTVEAGSGRPAHADQSDEVKTTVEGTGMERPLFQDVERAPIKVAQPAVVDTQSPQMEGKLAGELSKALEKGEVRVELRLAPQELGSVTVELTRTAGGVLQVLIQAADPKAAGLLKEHAAGLSTLLQGNAQIPVQVEVQNAQNSRNDHQQPWQQQGEGRGQGQHQQQERPRQDQSEDFLQQLRLGLVDRPA